MRLRTLHLEQFRSFRSAELIVEPEGFLLIGPNASGKSSILEAVSMLATTRSPRTSSERGGSAFDHQGCEAIAGLQARGTLRERSGERYRTT